jgi:multiple sugar transport system permease protein
VATTNPIMAETVPAPAGKSAGPTPFVEANRARRRKQLAASGVMLAPFAVLLGALLGWPIVWTILLSLTNEQLTGPTALHHQYIGFSNFQQLFVSSDFITSLIHSLAYLVGSAYIGQVGLGFALAFLLRTCSRPVQAAVGGIIVMSWIVPEIIAAFMWFALLGKSGVLQEALHAVGIPYSTILVSHPLLALDLANSWRGVAFSMMLFTAALATVPREIVEAATLDGASTYRRIIHVFIPFIKGSILIDVVLVTLATLNDFTLIFALTGGGPGSASQVLSTYMYQIGFTEYRIAYGTAVSVVLLAVGVLLSIFYVRALRRS